MSRLIDMTGRRYGRLTVIERAPRDSKTAYWLCRCDCGTVKVISGESIRAGHSKSCGCLSREVAAKTHGEPHGCHGERLYTVWNAMKDRCRNPNNKRYKIYGGRGITVCDDWQNSYSSFRRWAYENGYNETAKRGECTIDRIDTNGNYEPSNCRWVDYKTQAQNRRKVKNHPRARQCEYAGRQYSSLRELANAYGFDENKLYHLVHKLTPEEAMDKLIARRSFAYAKEGGDD